MYEGKKYNPKTFILRTKKNNNKETVDIVTALDKYLVH